MKSKKMPLLPVDIKLPERVLFDDGTLFVTLRTLDELEKFWQEHKDQFEFACEVKGWDSPIYLREYEWVFGTSKSAVVRTVMRWSESGVSCEFHDWSSCWSGLLRRRKRGCDCLMRMGKVNLWPESIRTCPPDAALTIDAWDQS